MILEFAFLGDIKSNNKTPEGLIAFRGFFLFRTPVWAKPIPVPVIAVQPTAIGLLAQ